MSARTRRTLAALVALLMLSLSASASQAGSTRSGMGNKASQSPVVFDVLILRPLGFVTLALGAGLFVISMPLVAVTRPQDIRKPYETFLVRPCRFLWKDDLGAH
jgi:hypothetical protein